MRLFRVASIVAIVAITFIMLFAAIAPYHVTACELCNDAAPEPPDWWPPVPTYLPIVRNGLSTGGQISDSVTWSELVFYLPIVTFFSSVCNTSCLAD